MSPAKLKEKVKETTSLWPFYSLLATVLRRFGVILLGVLVVVSGIVIAHQTHQMRQATIALKQLEDEQTALDLQWQKLSLEQSALSEHSRVESLAEKRLQMKPLDSRNEVLITPSVRGK
ncbi:cell division protein FtsL [Kangiella aquimarina]|uniref:Cell division protein FtsL n=1 Tax=Kangiella aquimarina TaxID=261965 RepID=A0ABZ0X3T0_9GAMM|nr:cell division protein FtsL [Kangiella aquimarina]WQG85031.1 cell division protein FtsL [Kangiella aquimarina]